MEYSSNEIRKARSTRKGRKMSDHNFYELTNNHNQREMTIVNVALLVGKAPTKERRIRIMARMVLSGHPNMGAPDWLSAAEVFVTQWHDPVFPAIDFKGYDLHFSSDNLFGAEGVKSPRCQIRSFKIVEFGPTEEPDVVANFTVYTPFSSALWEWLGAFGGESCWCSFTPGVVEAGASDGEEDGTLLDDGENDGENKKEGGEESADIFEDEKEEEVPAAAQKSGPTELAAYHEQQVQKEQKKGRSKSTVAAF